MTKMSGKKSKYLETLRGFWGGIKRIFYHLLRTFSYQKLSHSWECVFKSISSYSKSLLNLAKWLKSSVETRIEMLWLKWSVMFNSTIIWDGKFRWYTKISEMMMLYLPLIHKCINLRTPMCIYQFCPSCFGVCFTMSMSFFLMSFRYFNFFSEHIWISNTCQFVVEFLNVSRHDCLFLLANKDYFLLESLI